MFFATGVASRLMFIDEPAFANFLLFARFTHNRPDYPLLDDMQRVPEDWVQAIRVTGERLSARVAWQAGDVLMLDNTRFMHGLHANRGFSERLIATYFGYLELRRSRSGRAAGSTLAQSQFPPAVGTA